MKVASNFCLGLTFRDRPLRILHDKAISIQGDSTIQSKLDLLIDKIRYSIEKIKLLIVKKNFSKKSENVKL